MMRLFSTVGAAFDSRNSILAMILAGIALFALAGFFVWGAATIKYRVFPYSLIAPLNDTGGGISPTSKNEARESFFSAVSPDVDIAFVGDSITAQGEWGELFPDRKVANRGIGGQTYADILERTDSILATQPETIFIMAGINDAHAYRPEEAAGNFRELLDRLEGDGRRIIVQSTLECRACERRVFVQALNPLIEEITREKGLQWIDLNATMSDDGGLRSELTYDGTHLNGAGYLAWREAIESAL